MTKFKSKNFKLAKSIYNLEECIKKYGNKLEHLLPVPYQNKILEENARIKSLFTKKVNWLNEKPNMNFHTNDILSQVLTYSVNVRESLLSKLDVRREEVETKFITKRLRISTNNDMRKVLHKWMGDYRKTYNKCVELTKLERNEGKKANKQVLRNIFVTEQHSKNYKSKELTDKFLYVPKENFKFCKNLYSTPKEIRAEAVKEFTTKWNKSKKKNKTMGFKKKKNLFQHISLPKTCIPTESSKFYPKKEGRKYFISFYPSICNKLVGEDKIWFETKNKKFTNIFQAWKESGSPDFNISFDGLYYWLNLPVKLKLNENKTKKSGRVIGIDLGKRNIVTTYNQNQSYSYKTNEKLLTKNLDIMDYKQSMYDKRPTKINHKRFIKSSHKLSQQMDSWHTVIAKDIVQQNDTVILGKIDIQDLIKYGGENKSGFNRKLSKLKLYQFRQRLILECLKHDKKFILINESYTTKTCTCCGEKNDIGGNKIYGCKSCEAVIHRDTNASRNMIMKLISVVRNDSKSTS